MKIQYRKSFLKELSKIPSGTRSGIETFVFQELPEAKSTTTPKRGGLNGDPKRVLKNI